MALTPADKKDIEVMIRKEIKGFLDSNTLKQFETTMIEKIRQEIQKGKIKGDSDFSFKKRDYLVKLNKKCTSFRFSPSQN